MRSVSSFLVNFNKKKRKHTTCIHKLALPFDLATESISSRAYANSEVYLKCIERSVFGVDKSVNHHPLQKSFQQQSRWSQSRRTSQIRVFQFNWFHKGNDLDWIWNQEGMAAEVCRGPYNPSNWEVREQLCKSSLSLEVIPRKELLKPIEENISNKGFQI